MLQLAREEGGGGKSRRPITFSFASIVTRGDHAISIECLFTVLTFYYVHNIHSVNLGYVYNIQCCP